MVTSNVEAEQAEQAERVPRSSAHHRRQDATRIGVRTLLFFVLGASAVAPVGLLGFDQAERWAASELSSSDRQALGAARAAAAQLSIAMLAYSNAAESFSAQIGDSGRFDRGSLELAMGAHVHHHPEFIGAYVADAAGRSLAHIHADGAFTDGGIDYSDRDYYRRIVETGRATVSSVHIGRVTGVLTVQVAAPIQAASGFAGITCSSVDLGAITERAKDAVNAMSGGRLMLVDGEGRRIADSDATARLEPEDVSSLPIFALPSSAEPELRRGLDDRERQVRGFAVRLNAPVAEWRVLALKPQAAIDAQARLLERQTTLLVLGLGVVALAVAAALAAWLARPLRALADSAHAVTRGDFGALPEVPRRAPKEMALLTRAVRSMIERLQSHALDLERQVAARTAELSRANVEISGALETIRRHEQSRDADLEKARLFQAKLLPTLPAPRELALAAHYAPLERVGGDIYDVQERGAGHLRIFLADATGHGVQASMRTLILKSAYDRLEEQHEAPNTLLDALNAHLVAEFPDGDLHCTACCIDVRLVAGRALVTYCNAGSAPLYLFSADAPTREIFAEGPLLGVDLVSWPAPVELTLERRQLLVVASDGLTEQSNRQRHRFDARLSTLSLGGEASPTLALGRLLAEFEGFVDGEPIKDDVTVVVLGWA